MPSSKKNKLYRAFGKMIYLVAMADGLIQPEETESLEHILDEKGWSKLISLSFSEMVEAQKAPEQTYQEALEVFVAHGPDPDYQKLFSVLEAVAKASDGLDSDEADMLIDIEIDLRKKFLEDFERFELRYKNKETE